MQILADTNILLLRAQSNHPQHRETLNAMSRIADRGDQLCVANQNLFEFWSVCTRPKANNGFGLSPAQASGALAGAESTVLRLNDDTDLVYTEWKRLVTVHGVSGKTSHDARLVATMNVHGIRQILTFNAADFKRFEVVVVDPTAF